MVGSAIRILTVISLLIAVAVLLLWFFSGRHVLGDPDYSMPAKQLIAEFEASEIDAAAKYFGKVVEVTGMQTTSGIAGDRPWVLLDGKRSISGVSGVQCFFRSFQSASIVRKERPAKLKGRVIGNVIYVQLENCSGY